MTYWANDAVFYHIYPLGFCGAPGRNDFTAPPTPRLEAIYDWLDHIHALGVNALYLGPLFEASTHGYDTADYSRVDRRLGDNETLRLLIEELHRRSIRVILDGVFNHVGRDFFAFKDVQEHGAVSIYRHWFAGLRFDAQSPYGDPFTYDTWNGHYRLVKLNLHHPEVRAYLLDTVHGWIDAFGIDGLRLDAADSVLPDFLRELAQSCHAHRPNFWLMGEVVHGDYRQWVNGQMLDSVTNYECYKGLYSSLVDRNFFEIAYAFNRQFGAGGLYAGLPLYAFVDNHDVNRVASHLNNPAHLYPLYALLFTMPGVPSIYYGSEWGITGTRNPHGDAELRPQIDRRALDRTEIGRDLVPAIRRLTEVRHALPALRHGGYQQLFVDHEQFVFARQTAEQCVIVAVNAAERPMPVAFNIPIPHGARLIDVLNNGEEFHLDRTQAHVDLSPCWARIMVVV